MNAILNVVKQKVSADKNRFKTGEYDLDFTYITDRIVAMAFPAGGVEAAYRNKIDHVAAVLRKSHDSNFLIYNLSNRGYNSSIFDGHVLDYGFPDHHPPPLHLLFEIIYSIHDWLTKNPLNIAVIHCLAGKGRTGIVIACYFLYVGLFDNSEEALNFFACSRSENNWGVTGASQLRYVDYFAKIISGKFLPVAQRKRLVKIEWKGIPKFKDDSVFPHFDIYKLQREKNFLFSSEPIIDSIRSYNYQKNKIIFNTDLIGIGLEDDILIEFLHKHSSWKNEKLFHLVVNINMIFPSNILIFQKYEIEKVEKDERFSDSFSIKLVFANEEQDNTNNSDRDLQNIYKKLQNIEKSNGEICFFGKKNEINNKIEQARDVGKPQTGKISLKGGWITKRGHKVKNWKRRWLVLRKKALSYYKNPRAHNSVGVINLSLIKDVQECSKPIEDHLYCFEIETFNSIVYYISAPGEEEKKSWINAILYAKELKLMQNTTPKIGQFIVKVLHSKNCYFRGELCCKLIYGTQSFISSSKSKPLLPPSKSSQSSQLNNNNNNNNGEMIEVSTEIFEFLVYDLNSSISFLIWDNDWEGNENHIIGELSIPMQYINEKKNIDDWFELNTESNLNNQSLTSSLHVTIEFSSDSDYINNNNNNNFDTNNTNNTNNSNANNKNNAHNNLSQSRNQKSYWETYNNNTTNSFSSASLSALDIITAGNYSQPNLAISPRSKDPFRSPPGNRFTTSQRILSKSKNISTSALPTSPDLQINNNNSNNNIINNDNSNNNNNNNNNRNSILKRILNDQIEENNINEVPKWQSTQPSHQRKSIFTIGDPNNLNALNNNINNINNNLNNNNKNASPRLSSSPQKHEKFAKSFAYGDCFITCVYIYDNNCILLGDHQGFLYIWNILNEQLIMSKKIINSAINRIIAIEETIWTCFDDGIILLRTNEHQKLKVIERIKNQQPLEQIRHLIHVKSKNESTIWSGSSDLQNGRGSIAIYTPKTFKCKKFWHLQNSVVSSLYYQPNNGEEEDVVWVGTKDYILAFHSNNYNCTIQFYLGSGKISSMLLFEMKIWVIVEDSSNISVWDINKGEHVQTFSLHKGRLNDIILVDDVIWTCSSDKKILLWNPYNLNCITEIDKAHEAPVKFLCKLGNQPFVCSIAEDKIISLWKQY